MWQKTLKLKTGDTVQRATSAIGEPIPRGGMDGMVVKVHPRPTDPWRAKVKVKWSNGHEGSVEIRFLRRQVGSTHAICNDYGVAQTRETKMPGNEKNGGCK